MKSSKSDLYHKEAGQKVTKSKTTPKNYSKGNASRWSTLTMKNDIHGVPERHGYKTKNV